MKTKHIKISIADLASRAAFQQLHNLNMSLFNEHVESLVNQHGSERVCVVLPVHDGEPQAHPAWQGYPPRGQPVMNQGYQQPWTSRRYVRVVCIKNRKAPGGYDITVITDDGWSFSSTGYDSAIVIPPVIEVVGPTDSGYEATRRDFAYMLLMHHSDPKRIVRELMLDSVPMLDDVVLSETFHPSKIKHTLVWERVDSGSLRGCSDVMFHSPMEDPCLTIKAADDITLILSYQDNQISAVIHGDKQDILLSNQTPHLYGAVAAQWAKLTAKE